MPFVREQSGGTGNILGSITRSKASISDTSTAFTYTVTSEKKLNCLLGLFSNSAFSTVFLAINLNETEVARLTGATVASRDVRLQKEISVENGDVLTVKIGGSISARVVYSIFILG